MASSEFKSLTNQRNVNLSVLEAVFGSALMRPKYAKARAPKTPAIEKAEVVVNSEVVTVMVIAFVVFESGDV